MDEEVNAWKATDSKMCETKQRIKDMQAYRWYITDYKTPIKHQTSPEPYFNPMLFCCRERMRWKEKHTKALEDAKEKDRLMNYEKDQWYWWKKHFSHDEWVSKWPKED